MSDHDVMKLCCRAPTPQEKRTEATNVLKKLKFFKNGQNGKLGAMDEAFKVFNFRLPLIKLDHNMRPFLYGNTYPFHRRKDDLIRGILMMSLGGVGEALIDNEQAGRWDEFFIRAAWSAKGLIQPAMSVLLPPRNSRVEELTPFVLIVAQNVNADENNQIKISHGFVLNNPDPISMPLIMDMCVMPSKNFADKHAKQS